jgi:threonyl-tRNA synthetase
VSERYGEVRGKCSVLIGRLRPASLQFQQDDAHIFCELEQIESEIRGALEFVRDVYTTLGFQFSMMLSTRPKKYLGDITTWDLAEKVS